MTLSTAYLPSIDWFANLVVGEPICIEQWENYPKQTLRNRAYIDSPNGALALSVPIDKGNFVRGKCLTRDVRIAYHEDWQHQHWHAIASSYYNSPFFEYLQDDFRPIYERRWDYLIDLNECLIMKCCELLDIQPRISRTTEYVGVSPQTEFTPLPYYQVFAPHKHPFIPHLSIIDLIFNLGPEGLIHLNSIT